MKAIAAQTRFCCDKSGMYCRFPALSVAKLSECRILSRKARAVGCRERVARTNSEYRPCRSLSTMYQVPDPSRGRRWQEGRYMQRADISAHFSPRVAGRGWRGAIVYLYWRGHGGVQIN